MHRFSVLKTQIRDLRLINWQIDANKILLVIYRLTSKKEVINSTCWCVDNIIRTVIIINVFTKPISASEEISNRS